jgi:hypothetical protein
MYAAPALASEFLAYDGKDAIHDGRGGERKTVDGVDFWMTGDPPHRYQVLGSIVDRRHQSGLIGLAGNTGTGVTFPSIRVSPRYLPPHHINRKPRKGGPQRPPLEVIPMQRPQHVLAAPHVKILDHPGQALRK